LNYIGKKTIGAVKMTTRIQELEKQIKYHQDLYYNSQPVISDAEFDALWDELKRLDPSNVLFKTVGQDSGNFPKAAHLMKMGSQEKAANPDEFRAWVKKHPEITEYVVQYKLDGASLELQYEKGCLVKAVSRGNGDVGDDITANAMRMRGVTRNLIRPFSGAVRGEVLMPHAVHETKYSDKANCRNAANGIMKRISGEGSEDLLFMAYDAVGDVNFRHEKNKSDWLFETGFKVPDTWVFTDSEEVITLREKIAKRKAGFAFDIDGLVIKNKSIDLEDMKRDRPSKQIAFKFDLDRAVTTLLAVEWYISGKVRTPVAVMEPVQLNGTTVKQASLANPNLIKELGVKIGDTVEVVKRGEIIPKIESTVFTPADAKEIEIPEICVCCGTKLVNEGTILYCPNKDCDETRLHRIEKWVEKNEIMNLSYATIKKLWDAGIVKSIQDLYSLSVDKVRHLDGFGEGFKRVVKEIDKKRVIPLARFVAAFDLDGYGEKLIKPLFDALWVQNLEDVFALTWADIDKVPGWTGIRAIEFPNLIREVKDEMKNLSGVVKTEVPAKRAGGKLNGKSFCFTGALETLKRKDAENLVLDKGGVIACGVSKTLTYLVTNDTSSGSSKNKKAADLNIEIITEKEFLELIRQ
jgi:DNA ligase (NAD+)